MDTPQTIYLNRQQMELIGANCPPEMDAAAFAAALFEIGLRRLEVEQAEREAEKESRSV